MDFIKTTKEEVDEEMRKSSSCYINTYQYYANEITKKWNNEK
jgi:hypothetical protein